MRLPISPQVVPPRALAGAALAIVLVVTVLSLVRGGSETRTVTAHFSRAVSVFVGTEVRVLGVNIGEVTAVVPEGESVRVEMAYDPAYDVPADAEAVIVTPTLVADRFVQLTPVYTGGPRLADGADIPLAQTGSPVELDRIYASLSTLANALGPNGANRNGSLDDLLSVGARTLEGKGATANQMVLDLSRAAETFDNAGGDLFSTVEQLNAFTETLARNDEVVNRFMQDLARASGQLSGERQELDAALVALAEAVGTVRAFVKDNRKALVGQVEDLSSVLAVLVKEKQSLATALEKGPLGASNLAAAFDTKTGSIGSRINVAGNVEDLDGFLCAVVKNAQIPAAKAACTLFERLLEGRLKLPTAGQAPHSSTQVPGEALPATSLAELLGAGLDPDVLGGER
jgi:virulence factor Mce-like protein